MLDIETITTQTRAIQQLTRAMTYLTPTARNRILAITRDGEVAARYWLQETTGVKHNMSQEVLRRC